MHIEVESTSHGGMIIWAMPGKLLVAHCGSVADSQTKSMALPPLGLFLLPIIKDGYTAIIPSL
jgi:hypothetical protein